MATVLSAVIGSMGDLDLPPFVLQGHPHQVRQCAFIVDEQHTNRGPVGAVHPRQLT